ncbi:MAG TPA: hypothetical protein VI968_04650, partial [archaeon]|nr:hypothetical protein [archaeon]
MQYLFSISSWGGAEPQTSQVKLILTNLFLKSLTYNFSSTFHSPGHLQRSITSLGSQKVILFADRQLRIKVASKNLQKSLCAVGGPP